MNVRSIVTFFCLSVMLLAGCRKVEIIPEVDITITLESDDKILFGDFGGSSRVVFTAFTECMVNVTGASSKWCKVGEVRVAADGSRYFDVTVERNTDYDERSARIEISNEGGSKVTVSVIQKQKDAILLSSNNVEVDAEGGLLSLIVRANIEYDCQFKTSQDWIKVVPSQSTKALTESEICLYVEENEELQGREAKLYISAGDLNEVVTITQAPADPVLILSQTEFVLTSAGHMIDIEVQTNSDYKYEIEQTPCADTLWVEPITSRAMSTYKHSFFIYDNFHYSSRNAKIIFTNLLTNEQQSVTIEQLQRNGILLSKNEYYFDSRSHTLSLELLTNIDFDVEISEDWVTLSESTLTKALVEKQLEFNINKNNLNQSREAVITLSGQDVVQKVRIYQKERDERLRFDISHLNMQMQIPMFVGEYVYGDIFWGDGYKDEYAKRLSHSYINDNEKTMELDVYGADSFVIDNLTGITSIVLYMDKESSTDVEDVIVDKVEWD